jgi:hypothetical protein
MVSGQNRVQFRTRGIGLFNNSEQEHIMVAIHGGED